MIVHRGKLFAPVALDYVKALKTIISFQPHMDHLDDNNWITILRLAFNVVLRDPPRSAWENGDGEMDDSTFDAFDDEDNKGDIVLDSEDDEDPPSHIASARSKKRRRVATPSSRRSTPVEGPASKIRLTGGPHAASNEQVEFASILLILLRARSAPLLSPEHAYLPSAVLRRLQRFPVIYPAETSLHRDYLLTVSATLSHLALNRKHDVETFTRHTWSSLVELWGTGAKSRYIKEALIPVLQVLFPFLTVDDNSSSSWKDSVSKLWFLLDGEAETRWGVDGLSLDCLRLEVASVRESEEDGMLARPFVAQTFRAGWHFDPGQALAWAILELQADCTEKVRCLHLVIDSRLIIRSSLFCPNQFTPRLAGLRRRRESVRDWRTQSLASFTPYRAIPP
jgi:ataxia telangiectasia mutated family protein